MLSQWLKLSRPLKNTFYKKLPHISLNSETAKREVLVTPVLLELMDHIEIDIDSYRVPSDLEELFSVLTGILGSRHSDILEQCVP